MNILESEIELFEEKSPWGMDIEGGRTPQWKEIFNGWEVIGGGRTPQGKEIFNGWEVIGGGEITEEKLEDGEISKEWKIFELEEPPKQRRVFVER